MLVPPHLWIVFSSDSFGLVFGSLTHKKCRWKSAPVERIRQGRVASQKSILGAEKGLHMSIAFPLFMSEVTVEEPPNFRGGFLSSKRGCCQIKKAQNPCLMHVSFLTVFRIRIMLGVGSNPISVMHSWNLSFPHLFLNFSRYQAMIDLYLRVKWHIPYQHTIEILQGKSDWRVTEEQIAVEKWGWVNNAILCNPKEVRRLIEDR